MTKIPRLISPLFNTVGMSDNEIAEKLCLYLDSYRDNCGRRILPEPGVYDGFKIDPLTSWYNSEKFWFLSKLDNRVIIRKNDIYMNGPGNVEYYGQQLHLSAEKFSALMSEKIEIRLIDLMHAEKCAMSLILKNFNPINY